MGNFDYFDRNPVDYKYFDYLDDSYKNEQNLISVMINEMYNKYGVCMEYYVVSYDGNYDRIFGEDNDRSCVRRFNFSGYYQLPKEDKQFNKFGIEGVDEITMWVSKRHFDEASKDVMGSVHYPTTGDIVKSEYSTYFYEITSVAEDIGQFLQSNQHIWEIILKPMRNEHISTTPSTENSDFGDISKLDAIFNIDSTVDVEKESILYEPPSTESKPNNPFGAW